MAFVPLAHMAPEQLAGRELDDMISRCLAHDPHERFASAEALAKRLVPLLRTCPPLRPAAGSPRVAGAP